MNQNIIVRRVKAEDFSNMVKLYEKVWPYVYYNKSAKANFILNKSDGINFCAECDGEIIGSRTSFYQNLYYNNLKIHAVQLGDSCVHPDFQGKGIFQKMNKVFLDEFFENSKGELIFNISVPDSKKSYEKLGWKYIESLMALRKFVRPFHLIKSINFNIKNLQKPIVWDQETIYYNIPDELLSEREDLMSSKNVFHIRYDSEIFDWRFKSNSGIKIFTNEIGCIVYKLGRRGIVKEALIGEIFLRKYDKKSFKKLLKVFINSVTPDLLTVWVSEGHPLKQWYYDLYFINNFKQKYLFQGVKVVDENLKKNSYEPTNWALSSLDIDTF